MKTFIQDLLLILIIVTCLFGGGYTAFALKSKSCDTRAQLWDKNDYRIFGGCLVFHKGVWIPLENVHIIIPG